MIPNVTPIQSVESAARVDAEADTRDSATAPAPGAEIRWVLFDADGVLQRMPPGWRKHVDSLLGDDPAGTLEAIYIDERGTAMVGRDDFGALVGATLSRLGVETDPERVVDCWRMLLVDEEMLGRIRRLRSRGVRCALATNQQNVRVAHMRSMPEYEDLFDEQFYSSEVGAAKPDPEYFRRIIARLAADPAQVLFVDDLFENVASARSVSMRAEAFSRHGGVAELDRILANYRIPDASSQH